MENCYCFYFEVNAAFPEVCFFHAVKQVELLAKLLFGIYIFFFTQKIASKKRSNVPLSKKECPTWLE